MKTYEQLMKHYWGVIVPMAEAAGINPWECVKYNAPVNIENHPDFSGTPEKYTFALTVLEGKPVFAGDRLYWRDTGDIFDWERNDFNACLGCLGLTPPTKKRTFIVELDEQERNVLMHLSGTSYSKVLIGLHDKLTTARDKE